MSTPTRHQQQITCPECGHVESDSHELFTGFQGDGAQALHECEKCGKKMIVTMHVSVAFDAEGTL